MSATLGAAPFTSGGPPFTGGLASGLQDLKACATYDFAGRYNDLVRPISRMLVSTDVGDLGPEVRRLFDDLARRRPDRRHVVSGECLPVLDVLETEKTIEIVLDVPGVVADGLRIMIKAGVVLIAGEKERPELNVKGPASFHLVERDFGRFARAIRVHAAFDAGKVRARLQDGELRLVLPKIEERRGREFLVAIESVPSASSGGAS